MFPEYGVQCVFIMFVNIFKFTRIFLHVMNLINLGTDCQLFCDILELFLRISLLFGSIP